MARWLGLLPIITVAAWDDSGFMHWFEDQLAEVEDVPVVFEGKIPDYVVGDFVQTGPARFSYGKTKFTHMLDGYSKVNMMRFGKDGSTKYSSKFLMSAFMNDSIKDGHIARGMFVGDIEPQPHWGPTALFGPNDNNYIKMRKVGNNYLLLADTMMTTVMDDEVTHFEENIRSKVMQMFSPGVCWKDKLEPLGDLCMLGTMAHAHEDPITGEFIGAMGCFGLSGDSHIVFSISPSDIQTRKQIAKIPLPKGRRPSYMHSMAATPNYIVLIADPLYMNIPKMMIGSSLGRGGLDTNGDPTLFQIVDRKTGAVRSLEAPGFIYGHVVNSWEEGGDVVMDLTWYEANNMTTLGWMSRWFTEYMADDRIREEWPGSKIVRYRLGADGTVKSEVLLKEEKGANDFEVPKINEKLQGQPHCIAYMMQMHSYEYDKDPQSMVPGPMGACSLAKRNFCTGERLGRYVPNHYPSEIHFIPNPHGSAEDDGVLLGIVFDGHTRTSYFQILDARTLEQLAKGPLPVPSPFLIHASFFPEGAGSLTITI